MADPTADYNRHDPYAAVRVRQFRRFLSARICMTFAFQILDVIVYWQVYKSHPKDPQYVGYLGLLEALPQLAVALYAGHLADIYNRKKISVLFLSAVTICVGVLFGLTMQKGFIDGPNGLLSVFGLVFMIGLTRGFVGPALFGLLGQVVPRSLYTSATTWNSTVWHTAAVAGPALGGLAYARIGLHYTYALVLVFLIISVTTLSLVVASPFERGTKKESLRESLLSGIRFVFRNQIILGALSLDLFAVLFGGVVALLPYFADNVLNVNAEGLGLLRAAQPFGAILMSVVLIYVPLKRNAGRNVLLSVAGFGLCMIGFAYSHDFILSMVLMAASGMLDNVSVVIRSTILQLLTPDNMRGRVSAVNSIFIGSSNEIGAFESGIAAKLMGYIPSVIFGGIMTLGVVGTSAIAAPKLRDLDLANLNNEGSGPKETT